MAANGSGIFFHESRGGAVAASWIGGNRLIGVSYLFSPGGRVTGNLITSNGAWGLQANLSSGLVLSDNAITRNGSAGQSGGGAFVADGSARIERNALNRNLGDGLLLSEGQRGARPVLQLLVPIADYAPTSSASSPSEDSWAPISGR